MKKTNNAKFLWTIAVLLMLGMTSCANDYDDFLIKNDKELSDLKKEDAAIRRTLSEQVEQYRTQLKQKIDNLETVLQQLIEDGGKSIYDQLASKMSQTKKLINDKFDNFETEVDAKLPELTGSLERSCNKLDVSLAAKKKQLASAIEAGDKENEKLIQAEIGKISALLSKITAAKSRMDSFETQIARLEQNNADIIRIEQSVSLLQEKYKGQAAEFEKVNGQIRKMIDETFDNLSGEQLKTYQGLLDRAKTLTDEMVTKIEDFQALSDRLDDIKGIYDNATADLDPSELVDKVEELSSSASELESILDDIGNLPLADDFDLSEISAPLEDMIPYGAGELLQLVEIDLKDYELDIEYLDRDSQTCWQLLSKLESLINEYNDIRDNMFG